MLNTHRLSKTAAAVSAVLASMSVCVAQALPEMGVDIRVDTDLTQLDLTQSAYAAKNIAFRMEGQNLTLDPKDESLTFDSNRRGICVYSAKDPKVPSHLVIGTNSTQDVTVNVQTNNNRDSDSAGIVILRLHQDADGKLTSANAVGVPSAEINGKNLTVNVHNEGTGEVRGINIQNNTTTSDEFASLVINSENIAINELKLDDGVISLSKELVEAGQAVKVESLSGTGGTINTHVDTQTDGTLVAGQFSVDKLENAASLKVVASNVTADDVTAESAGKTLEVLGKTVAVKESSTDAGGSTVTAVVDKGEIKGAITQVFDTSGTAQGEAVEQANTKLTAFGSVAALSAFQWQRPHQAHGRASHESRRRGQLGSPLRFRAGIRLPEPRGQEHFDSGGFRP